MDKEFQEFLKGVAQNDQIAASVAPFAQMVASYYRALVAVQLPEELAFALVREWHAMLLARAFAQNGLGK